MKSTFSPFNVEKLQKTFMCPLKVLCYIAQGWGGEGQIVYSVSTIMTRLVGSSCQQSL